MSKTSEKTRKGGRQLPKTQSRQSKRTVTASDYDSSDSQISKRKDTKLGEHPLGNMEEIECTTHKKRPVVELKMIPREKQQIPYKPLGRTSSRRETSEDTEDDYTLMSQMCRETEIQTALREQQQTSKTLILSSQYDINREEELERHTSSEDEQSEDTVITSREEEISQDEHMQVNPHLELTEQSAPSPVKSKPFDLKAPTYVQQTEQTSQVQDQTVPAAQYQPYTSEGLPEIPLNKDYNTTQASILQSINALAQAIHSQATSVTAAAQLQAQQANASTRDQKEFQQKLFDRQQKHEFKSATAEVKASIKPMRDDTILSEYLLHCPGNRAD